MKEKNFISAVVYINNCETKIEYFLKNLEDTLKKKFDKFEIICVNDASIDNSVEKIKKIANSTTTNITSINMSFYQGREFAMNAGVDLAIGDFVYEFDSIDIDYDLDIILKIYEESLKGNDIVNASAKGKKYATSSIFYTIFNKFSNSQYKISTETFRILSRRAINRINSINNTITFRKAIYANCGLKLATVFYEPNEKKKNKLSKNIKNDRRKTATEALLLFTNIGYKISFYLSLLMMVIAIIVGIYTVVIFLGSQPIAGWTTTMLFMAFGFFGIFALFAIVLKYLSLIINLIFKNKRYLIESIDKLN